MCDSTVMVVRMCVCATRLHVCMRLDRALLDCAGRARVCVCMRLDMALLDCAGRARVCVCVCVLLDYDDRVCMAVYVLLDSDGSVHACVSQVSQHRTVKSGILIATSTSPVEAFNRVGSLCGLPSLAMTLERGVGWVSSLLMLSKIVGVGTSLILTILIGPSSKFQQGMQLGFKVT